MDNNDKVVIMIILCGLMGYLLWSSNDRVNVLEKQIEAQKVQLETTDKLIDKLRNF